MKNLSTKYRYLALFLGVLALGSAISFWVGRSFAPSSVETIPTAPIPASASTYYCTMHPHIRLPHPGKCSLCPMDLVPLLDASDPGPRSIEISEAAAKLAEIETAKVRRGPAVRTIRMVGKIDFDETQVKVITARVPGRLDRLYVDYTGVPITKGDHLVDIYSPKLFVAQRQLLEAKKAVESLKQSDSEFMRSSSLGTLRSVREKLRLLGLSAEQIEVFEQRGEPSDHVLINAPIGGVVVSKMAHEGDYVDTAKPIYRIAELSHLWVKLDAYESDLTWLLYGQEVEFHTESFPGELFRGKISFIDWVVLDRRTTTIRVNVENPDLRLKPGMFVRAEVHSTLAGGGLVRSPALRGKWISPMHPEIVKDGPGVCDVCGMELVPAEKFFRIKETAGELPLLIPTTAALITGKRAVVYVKVPDREKPTFEGREVLLGPRAGDHYVVLSGLEEGEDVVTRGSFKIDSSLQIQAKPSLMNPKGGGPVGGHQHGQHGGAAPKLEPPPDAEEKGGHAHE